MVNSPSSSVLSKGDFLFPAQYKEKVLKSKECLVSLLTNKTIEILSTYFYLLLYQGFRETGGGARAGELRSKKTVKIKCQLSRRS
jgi:hypothetical protein